MKHQGLHFQSVHKSMDRLQLALRHCEKSEAAFLKQYTTVRQHAFEVEMLAKFYRKVKPGDKAAWNAVHILTKSLEDRLGRFGEIDEMISYCRKHDVRFSETETGVHTFTQLRDKSYLKLQHWMKREGWRSERFTALAKIQKSMQAVTWLDEGANRQYASRRLSKALHILQDRIQSGEFYPRRRGGYQLREVEPKVHELRREVRLMAQYMVYCGGLFHLQDRFTSPSKRQLKTLAHYAPLLETKIVDSPYAKLPRAQVTRPLPIPRVLFLGLTHYVDELGTAKDWPLRLDRLRLLGAEGQIHLDQVTPELTNWQGVLTPFNKIVDDILNEMRDRRIFAVMAELLEAGADNE